ncbi:uncharacterized protein LOC129892748 [Solanum dulcamara]|uniref:uncharacterized protein LOC129892748 n=1 Tax=Solanum dulcamara TaxID=45834 RepID=UPI002485C2F9|nr:uncharacterized protein LOC129892748 [Solanum dulcamara]
MVRDREYLRVTPMKGVKRFGRRGKLSPKFIDPFEILRWVGDIGYELALPAAISGVHLIFHVFMRQYILDESHMLQWDSVQFDKSLAFEKGPVAILDRQVRKLRFKDISSVKV